MKVVSIHGENVPVGSEPAPEIIKQLEEALEEAKRGEIKAYCIIKVNPNSHWESLRITNGAETLMMGALAMVQMDICTSSFDLNGVEQY